MTAFTKISEEQTRHLPASYTGPVKVNQKISFSIFISFEPIFGNPIFETPEKQNVEKQNVFLHFQLTCFSSIVNFILWFWTASAVKPGVLNSFLSYIHIAFWCSIAKEDFQTKLFKTRVLTQTDIENPKKIPVKHEKNHFQIYFNRTNVDHCIIADLYIGVSLSISKKLNTFRTADKSTIKNVMSSLVEV